MSMKATMVLLFCVQYFRFSVSMRASSNPVYVRTYTGSFLQSAYQQRVPNNGVARVLQTVSSGQLDQTRNLLFKFNAPFIEGEPLGGQRWCLDCRNGSEVCVVDMFPCHFGENHYWFSKIHPNQTEGPHGQLGFSIFSEMHPKQCMTYTGTKTNRFQLAKCKDPPTTKQTFYIESNYFDLIQEAQELKILKRFHDNLGADPEEDEE